MVMTTVFFTSSRITAYGVAAARNEEARCELLIGQKIPELSQDGKNNQ